MLNQTMQLLKAEFKRRGWSADIPYIGTAHCFVDRGDGLRLHIFSATPPTSSFGAAHMANDKYATYQLLQQNGLRQLETLVLRDGEDTAGAQGMMARYGRVVAKPLDGGHGKGITVNVATSEKLLEAIKIARAHTKSSEFVLVQQQYEHEAIHDIRILCIDYKFVAAIWRVAARVYGDGVNSVRRLIEVENASSRRGKPYFAPLASINMTAVEGYLTEQELARVPATGEEISVLGIANYGAGGETIDVTDDIPDWLRREAERVSRVSELPVAGVDFMTSRVPTVASTEDELDAVVIEINKCPALMIHDRPTSGQSRHVVTTYADYLAGL